VEWLVDELGVTLEVVTEFNYRGHSRHRMHAPPDRSGATLSQKLAVALERERGIELVCEAPVHSLVIDEQGAVVGVGLERSGTQWVSCQGVILASCGFGANPEMVADYCPEIREATYFGAAGNTGDAIRWAMDLGAGTENMDAYQGHASLAHPHGTLLTWGVIIQGGFLVNQSGQRFGNESEGYSGFAVQVLRQPRGLAFAIFDEPICQALAGFADFADLVDTGGVHKANTIEDLARMLDIDGGKLSQTLHEYAEAAGGKPDKFGRSDISRPLSPPYCGVQVTAALFHTQGGVRIDRNARVLRSDGSHIPQLYAGGGVAVGISGSGASGYLAGNGLLAALGLGRIAGEHAAHYSRDYA
jgi:fumarate reductase flavoprotein subunit